MAPTTQARCERLIDDVSRIAPARFTLLVVPRYHHQPSTPAFERWLDRRLGAGDELALHGFTHLDETPVGGGPVERLTRRSYTAGEGEFAALGRDAATLRLDAGRDFFARRGWPVRGFVAPAWLLGAGAWEALATQPFDYTCTLRRLMRRKAHETGGWLAWPAWSVVFSTRAAWRRQAAVIWNRALGWRQRRVPWIRFELHPDDFAFEPIRAATLRAIRHAAGADRAPITLGAAADRLVVS